MPRSGDPDKCRAHLGGSAAAGQQPVAVTQQQVSCVECHRDAVLDVERFTAIPPLIAVLDVVVDERRFVKALHRHGGLAY